MALSTGVAGLLQATPLRGSVRVAYWTPRPKGEPVPVYAVTERVRTRVFMVISFLAPLAVDTFAYAWLAKSNHASQIVTKWGRV
jgi:hypothetical protein